MEGKSTESAQHPQNEWLVRLNRFSATINLYAETRPLLNGALVSLMELIGADGGQCQLYGPNRQLTMLVSHGLPRSLRRRLKETGEPPPIEVVEEALCREEPVCSAGENDSFWQQLAQQAGYQTLLALPLAHHGDQLGVCLFYHREKLSPSADELRLLMIAGGQLATAVERARLLATEKNQRKHIEAVQRAGAMVNRSLDLEAVLDSILTELAHVIRYDSAAIVLREEAGLLVVAARGVPSFSGPQLIAPNNELSKTIARTHEPLILADAQTDPRFGGWLGTEYVRGWMGIPLLVQDTYIGHLTADSRWEGAYTDADAARALTFAQQAAIAVTNARLHQDVQAQLAALKEAQARLLQTEKLAALGRLVSGVAHELNNPLAAIQLHGELALEKTDSKAPSRQELDQILMQVQRASNIVETLLDFARQRPPVRRPVEVNEVVNSTLEMMRYELRSHHVSLDVDLAPELPSIMADPGQLQQVIVNLVANAYQAMSRVNRMGRLRVRTALAEPPMADKRAVSIVVSDNGDGIPESEMDHIFEPFYTTREPGQGTGLGLSVCHGIITEHGGQIWAESKVGEGAVFCVTLPAEPGEGDPREDQASDGEKKLADCKILIVDDESSLRLAIQDILTLMGCRVQAVADGRAGLAAVAESEVDDGFDLILCDVRMPGLGGPEFYRELLATHPGFKGNVLFITGDRLNADTRRFLDQEQVRWLAKPFDVEELLQRLEQILIE